MVEQRRQGEIVDGIITGLNLGNKIYLPTLSAENLMSSFWHEAGHIVGKKLSFLGGEVLTPDEAKQTVVEMTLLEKLKLHYLFYEDTSAKIGIAHEVLPIAERIFNEFTKGNFSCQDLVVFCDMSQQELINIFKRGGKNPTLSIRDNQLVLRRNTRGRNIEIPAYAVEVGCFHILNNSNRLPSLYKYEGISFAERDPNYNHTSALGFVRDAYESTGCMLPSLKDMKRYK